VEGSEVEKSLAFRKGFRELENRRAGPNHTQTEIVMNRFHVHVHVADLEANVRFCSQLFGAEPAVRKHEAEYGGESACGQDGCCGPAAA
jgi:hypothetical protein